MLSRLNYKTEKTGFTLVEMLVAIAVFFIIIGVASGIFISTIRAQRYNLAYQELLNQTSYVAEYMSRSLRMAKKDLTGNCIGAGLNYDKTANGIKFIDYENKCTEFFLGDHKLKKRVTGNDAGEWELTSPQIEVERFLINLVGEGADYFQPRVTFSLDIEGREQTRIKIQTSISQRNLDI